MGDQAKILFFTLSVMLIAPNLFVGPFTSLISSLSWEESNIIHVASVVCKDESRIEETIISFKSILLHTQSTIMFHVFAEDQFYDNFFNSLKKMQQTYQRLFKFQIHKIQYPEDAYKKKWKKLFKPCASQRLFIPYILTEVDSLIYIDTDVLFLSPIEDLWSKLSEFNSTQVAGMAAEHEHTTSAWYSRFARHPYYGQTGINSGVMLMNMTRIRNFKFLNDVAEKALHWNDMMLPLYDKYNRNITWGDQDLLNVIFHYNPDMLLELSCDYNYRPDHCMYMPLCDPAKSDGVRVLHGCRRAFHVDKWPIFRAVYRSIHACALDGDENFRTKIVEDIEERMNGETSQSLTSCEKSKSTVIKRFMKEPHAEL